MSTFTYTEKLTVVHCTCGIPFAIPDKLHEQLLRERHHKSVCCPLGHSWHYTGKSDAEKLRDAETRLQATRDLLAAEERSHAATRGVVTRQKKKLVRVTNGVCPCCNRTFQNLMRHMQTKHPEHVADTEAHTG